MSIALYLLSIAKHQWLVWFRLSLNSELSCSIANVRSLIENLKPKMLDHFLIVSYDIPSNRRRYKVMKILEGFGSRVQYSVFECRLKPREIEDLRRRLKKLIVEDEDSVRFYFLGAEDVKRIERLGDTRTVEEKIFIMQ